MQKSCKNPQIKSIYNQNMDIKLQLLAVVCSGNALKISIGGLISLQVGTYLFQPILFHDVNFHQVVHSGIRSVLIAESHN